MLVTALAMAVHSGSTGRQQNTHFPDDSIYLLCSFVLSLFWDATYRILVPDTIVALFYSKNKAEAQESPEICLSDGDQTSATYSEPQTSM